MDVLKNLVVLIDYGDFEFGNSLGFKVVARMALEDEVVFLRCYLVLTDWYGTVCVRALIRRSGRGFNVFALVFDENLDSRKRRGDEALY